MILIKVNPAYAPDKPILINANKIIEVTSLANGNTLIKYEDNKQYSVVNSLEDIFNSASL
jgi:hypothetical protein